MKQSINLGAYGWRHKHWLNDFYPEDLPVGGSENNSEDWRLTYYSNEFNAVLVPSDYWYTGETIDCEGWLDDVHDEFQFFVECHVNMLKHISLSKLTENLKKLQPQLSALVFLDENDSVSHSGLESGPESVKKQFNTLIEMLELELFTSAAFINSAGGVQAINICWPGGQAESGALPGFALIENDLSDLRLARTMLENVVRQSGNNKQWQEKYNGKSTIIVNHPQLKANDLSKFRSVLEIMGY